LSEDFGGGYDHYGPWVLKRDLWVWFVAKPNYTAGGYAGAEYFFRKEKAIAHMVALALKGEEVKL
jgi:hypothetical protein